MDLIQVMKALSDETRIRIINLLREHDLCVCEIEAILDINQSNASRHLNKLTNAKVLDYYKVAKYVYYKINEEIVKEYPFIRDIISEHTMKLNQCKLDYEKLLEFKNKGIDCDCLVGEKQCQNINKDRSDNLE